MKVIKTRINTTSFHKKEPSVRRLKKKKKPYMNEIYIKGFKDRIKSTYWAKTPAEGLLADASDSAGRLDDGCAAGGPSNTHTRW